MSNLIESIITSIQNNMLFALAVVCGVLIAQILSLAIIFKKIGHKPLYAFIPVYNVMKLLEILNMPKWMVLLMFVPFVNVIGIVYLTILIGYKLGSLCRKSFFMKVGLMILPILFYPILAFTDIELEERLIVVKETVKKVDFTLAPVDLDLNIELQQAYSLNDSAVLDAIMPKVGVKIEKKKEVKLPDESLDEHLAKANKEKPTAQDLTFNYNLVYNSKETKEEIVKEIIEDEPKKEEASETPVEEEIINPIVEEVIDDTPLVPEVHDVVLEMAAPLDADDLGPIPINKRFDNQINANREQIEEKRRLQQEAEEQLEEELAVENSEEIQLIENGPIELDESLSGLLAAAPDFSIVNIPKEEEEKVEIDYSMAAQVKENVPTTEVRNIVRMDIVEPSQLPVGVLNNENVEKIVLEEQPVESNVNDALEEKKEETTNVSLLRPTTADSNLVQIDKVCPQCSAKLKRDCPVCIICGYKF